MAERSARKTLEPLLERQQQSVAVRDSMATLRKHSAAAFLPSRLLHRVEAGRVADLEAALEDFRASMPLVPASGGRVWVGVAEESREALFHVALGAQVDMCRAEMSADDVTRLLRLLHGIASELGPGAYEMRAMDGSARWACASDGVWSFPFSRVGRLRGTGCTPGILLWCTLLCVLPGATLH